MKQISSLAKLNSNKRCKPTIMRYQYGLQIYTTYIRLTYTIVYLY